MDKPSSTAPAPTIAEAQDLMVRVARFACELQEIARDHVREKGDCFRVELRTRAQLANLMDDLDDISDEIAGLASEEADPAVQARFVRTDGERLLRRVEDAARGLAEDFASADRRFSDPLLHARLFVAAAAWAALREDARAYAQRAAGYSSGLTSAR